MASACTRGSLCLLACSLFLGAWQAGAGAEPVAPAEETLLLQYADISEKHVVFHHAHDLWVTDRSGGAARPLTTGVGREVSARISPDGRWVAYSAEYQGNADVYVVSIDGGMPVQLTWHPGNDYVRDWSPDGSHILFNSMRHGAPPSGRLYTVPVLGGHPKVLPIPRANHAAYSPDGKHIAYTPIFDAFSTWKRYRGGRIPPIWIYDVATHEVEEIPHVRASDTLPQYVGNDIYFLSDRTDQMNLFRYDTRTKTLKQITNFVKNDFGIRWMAAGDGSVVYERGGALYVYQPGAGTNGSAEGTTTRLRIRVPADGLSRRARWQTVGSIVRNASIAPNGKRAVFEARGEIITVPREHGAPRNLSASPGAHDRSPVWSPDGKKVAWFSDASGEYELVVRDRKGREAPKTYKLDGAGFYMDPVWGPKSKRILYGDKANRLATIELASGKITEVTKTQGSLGMWRPFGVWSKDGNWIAIETLDPHTSYGGISLFDVETGKTTPITDGFSSADSPVFSKDGKHLFFRASVDAGPRKFGLDMGAMSAEPPKASLYVVVLKKDGKHPLGPRSDEGLDPKKPKNGKKAGEKKSDKKGKDDAESKEDDSKKQEEKDDDKKKSKKDKGDEKSKGPSIDIEDIDQRILALPLGADSYFNLATTSKALVFTVGRRGGTLKSFDFKSRKAKTLLSKVTTVRATPSGKHLLVRTGSRWSVVNESGKDKKDFGISSVRVRVEPEKEWPQTLREAWRIQRDFFYDPNMHGVDWDACWDRWSALLPHVQHRADLNLLIGEMMGELACGHEYVSGGEYSRARAGPTVGLLGADWTVEGNRYRITRVYRGQNWNPRLRAPLTEPGVDASVGDYLISINGQPVTSNNLYAAFVETAGRPTEIELSSNPDGSKSRTSTVVPLASDTTLRRMAWVEANRMRVEEKSGGRLAYVYMPNTGGGGKAAFDRDYYSQLDKEGLILDERYNGGGKVADYVIERLSRKVMCYWMNREGWLARTPFGTLDGPKVMVINERAGSGGDAMPWMFQQLGIGKLVGTRTWGGLVGVSGYPPLMDGGRVTAANFGIMDTQGNWVVENEGVTPDIEVIEYPKPIIEGQDPQLDKAIEVAMEALAKRAPKRPPAYKPPAVR